MSFRTERSVVKNLGYIHVGAIEILRFALNDIWGGFGDGDDGDDTPFYNLYTNIYYMKYMLL